jgi:hypothetical protein
MANIVGDNDWVEKHMTARHLTGESLVKHTETGYLELPNGKGFNGEKKRIFMGTLNAKFNVGKALQKLGMARVTLYDAIALDPLFRQHYIECIERNVDNAEEKLIENATENSMASAERMFFLKKRRAAVYGDKLELKLGAASDPLLKSLLGRLDDDKYDRIPKADIVNVPEQKQ